VILSVVFLARPVWWDLARVAGWVASPESEPSAAVEFFALNLEAKYVVGFMVLLERAGPPGEASRARMLERLAEAEAEESPSADWVRSRLILLRYLGDERGFERVASMSPRQRQAPSAAEGVAVETPALPARELVDRLYLEERPLKPGDLEPARREMGFLGRLAALEAERREAAPGREAALARLEAEAVRYTFILAGVFTGLMGLGVAGLVLLAVGLRSAARGGWAGRMRSPSIGLGLLWETFALYLAALAGGSLLREAFPGGGLGPAVMLELAALGLLFYPLFRGASFRPWLETLGVSRGSGIGRELASGLAGYAAALPLMGLGLVASAALASATPLKLGEGVHPIAPLLAEEGGSAGRVAMIVALAVAIAPILEELLFRGYFYAALRRRLSAPAAVALSATVFAAIHPQGVLGLAPLAAIGVALAALREWRGSLIAPIVAHAAVNGVTMTVLLAGL